MAFGGGGGVGGVAARFLSAVARQARRVPSRGWKVLSSKQAPRGLSKGKGCARTGVQGPDGRFRPVASMLPTYVLPPGGLAPQTGGAGAGDDASSAPQPLLRPYVAEYPQEQLDAAVAALRARLAAQAARSEALGADRRARGLEAARRMRWAQQQQQQQGGASAASDDGAAAAAKADAAAAEKRANQR